MRAPASECEAEVLLEHIEKCDAARPACPFLGGAHAAEASPRRDARVPVRVPGVRFVHRFGLEVEANLLLHLLLVGIAAEESAQAMPNPID
jgi:hypothetical protein